MCRDHRRREEEDRRQRGMRRSGLYIDKGEETKEGFALFTSDSPLSTRILREAGKCQSQGNLITLKREMCASTVRFSAIDSLRNFYRLVFSPSPSRRTALL